MLRLRVPDEGCPVGLTQPLPHAALVPDARLGLGEEGAPPLGSAVAAHTPHVGGKSTTLRRSLAPGAGESAGTLYFSQRLAVSVFAGNVSLPAAGARADKKGVRLDKAGGGERCCGGSGEGGACRACWLLDRVLACAATDT